MINNQHLETQNRDTQALRHLVVVVVSCGITLLCAAMISAVIDPYLRLEWFRIEGMNAARPMAVGQVRMAKAYQVLRQNPTTIVLGNSRVDLGIDPASEFWPQEMRPAYNAGQPGGGMWSSLRYLQHASAGGNTKYALLGCDFFDFLQDQSDRAAPPAFHPAERRLLAKVDGSPNRSRWREQLNDSVYSLLSASALMDSAITVARQGVRHSADINTQGLTSGEPFRTIIARQGQHSLIQEKNAEYKEKLNEPRISLFREGSSESFAWETLDRLLVYCLENKIELCVFTHPYHTDILRQIDQAGRWEEFEQWKRNLMQRCHQFDPEIPVLDFSCVCEVTNEAIPRPDDRKSVMRWYWESGHYRKETGDLILEHIYRGGKSARNSSEFNSRHLKQEMLDEHFRKQREMMSLVLSSGGS